MSTDAEILAMFESLDPARQKELFEYQEQVRQDTANAKDWTAECLSGWISGMRGSRPRSKTWIGKSMRCAPLGSRRNVSTWTRSPGRRRTGRGLNAVLAYARDGDVIVVHTLDRVGRTVRDTLNLIHDLAQRGVGVRNLADPIRVDSANPSDPMAQLAVVPLALFGQMEPSPTAGTVDCSRVCPRQEATATAHISFHGAKT